MKSKIKKIVRYCLYWYRQRKHEKFYHLVMKMNGIKDTPVPDEEKWLKRWSQFGMKAKPTQYRVFSNYIGQNMDIVPEDVCHTCIEPILNPFMFAGYYSDKNIFDRLFPQGYFPRTILRKMQGFFYDCDYNRLSLNESVLDSILQAETCERIILKPSVDAGSGVGVKMFTKAVEGGYFCDSIKLTFEYLENKCGRDIILQEGVEQSDYISQFNPSSVNTLRISLYRSVKDDECHVTSAIMRIGGKGSVVDNAHAGGCYVGINLDGTLCHEVLDQYGRRSENFNGVDFTQNFIYPRWNEVTEFARSVGKYVPHHRLLALDIVLDKNNNPRLIEINCLYYSSWLFQYTIGPAFGKFTDEILEYCRKNSCYNALQLYV